jgi:mono/diheme cytochrome c family protein
MIGLLVAVAPFAAAGRSPLEGKASGAGPGVFKAKCVACHGQDGSGSTAVGKSLKTADLRSAEVQKKSDTDLIQSITEGKGNMPAFKSALSEDEIQAVLAHVRGFAAKADPASRKRSGN